MIWRIVGAVTALLLGLGVPAAADHTDGFDNNGNGLIDESAENNHGAPQPGGMEGECIATARPEICLAYFQFNCQTYGFSMACSMASLGPHCSGGDPAQCQHFITILQTNSACYFGDQTACAALSQQGLSSQ